MVGGEKVMYHSKRSKKAYYQVRMQYHQERIQHHFKQLQKYIKKMERLKIKQRYKVRS